MENQGRCGKKLNSTASHWIVGWHWVGLGAPGSCSVFHEWLKMVFILFRALEAVLRCTSVFDLLALSVSTQPRPTIKQSKSNADRQKKNKNHFRPISEQACAPLSGQSEPFSLAYILTETSIT